MGAPGQALIWGQAGPAARRGWGPESLWIRVFMTGCVITCRDAEAVKVNLRSCLSPSPTRSRPSVWGAGLQELCSRAGTRPCWQWRKKRLPCVHGGEGMASGPSPCCWLLPCGWGLRLETRGADYRTEFISLFSSQLCPPHNSLLSEDAAGAGVSQQGPAGQ